MKEPEDCRIYLHKSNNPNALLHETFGIIREIEKNNPFERKTVVVQSEAMGRWLALKAADENGIAANIEFVTPDKFLRNFAEKYLGIKANGSVFNKKNTEWALYSLFKSDFLEKPVFMPIKNYIQNDERRCFGLCRKIADLFEQYAVYRPHIIAAWQKGKVCSESPDEIWQKEIFLELKRLDPFSEPDFAKVFIEKCQSAQLKAEFTKPLILFGISRMNKYHLNMFTHLSVLFPVHIFAILPSSEYIYKVDKKNREEKETFFRKFCEADMEITDFFVENPLFQESDIFVKPTADTLLSSIQRDILEDKEKPEEIPCDDSVRISACCGKMRETEVLKDSLLELFKDDETLSPEDIVVLCPDLKSYEPYINAVFGNSRTDDSAFIPFVITEGETADEAKISETFLKIIRLSSGNYGKSEILSIFKEPCVCGKFGISRENFPEIEKLLEESGVKRGLDSSFMEKKYRLSGQNTWEFGLKRIMMSSFMPFSEKGEGFEDILPVENFRQDKIVLAEGFITFVKELFRFAENAAEEKTPSEFKSMLVKALDFFFVDDKNSSGGIRHLKEIISSFAERAGKYAAKIHFDAVRTYIEDEIAATVFRKNTVGSKLNFSSLKQMHNLPFRVVCLIGMDEDSFPRKDTEYAFDLTHLVKAESGEPKIRSLRENDSDFFLDAILSAGEKLIISYDGKEQREDSKKHRMAAMPVRILEKYIAEKTGKNPDETEVKYPALPFSAEYFTENGAFKTFSKAAFRVAEKMFHVEHSSSDLSGIKVSEEKEQPKEHLVLAVDDLISFFKDPQKYYFTKTLKMILPDEEKNNVDEEIFDYDDSLMNYSLRQTYIKMAENTDDEKTLEKDFIRRMKGEGKIPAGIVGEEKLKALIKNSGLWEFAGKLYAEKREHCDFSFDFEELGVTLCGRNENIRSDSAIQIVTSKWDAKHKISSLIKHFAMNTEGIELDTHTYALNQKKEVRRYTLEKTDAATAKNNLAVFVELWKKGQKEMPLYNSKIIENINKNSNICDDMEKEKKDKFVSLYFLLMVQQFEEQNRRSLGKLPLEEMKKAANFMTLFKNERKSNKTGSK